MKACVYFQPREKNDNFEGARLRENLKGALKENNISYASNIVDTYDVIHFISPSDLLKINDATENRIPVVISALYCESDESASFLKELNEKEAISNKSLKALNKASVVLTSDELSKHLLKELGVTSPIEIVSSGVDLSRFEFEEENKDIFYQYYQLDKNKKFVVVIGTYDDRNTPKKLIAIADKCPDYNFFYFGNANTLRIVRQNHKMPQNVRLCQLIDNEIYCSMMVNASIYLSLENKKHSPITLLDAAASKTQIVALEPTHLNKKILELTHAYIAKDENEVADIINKLNDGTLENRSSIAYEYAKENSLKNVGKKLIRIYQNLIDRR